MRGTTKPLPLDVAELIIYRRRTLARQIETLRRNQDANVIRHDTGRDKAIVEFAVIALPGERGVAGRAAVNHGVCIKY